jgi:hypothetical protein
MLWLAAGLLGGVAGCQHQATAPANGSGKFTPVAAKDIPDPKLVQKESELPKRNASPEVFVKFGDFQAGEAAAPWLTPPQAEQKRETARKAYQRALAADAKFLPAYLGLARLYTAVQDHAHAVETYQRGLKAMPQNAPLWYELGMCHNAEKEWGPTLECLGQAVKLDPENRDYINTLGVALARAGRFQESLDCFGRVSSPAMAHYKLARTLQHLQQPELSRRHLELALQKDPGLASAQAMMTELNGPPASTMQRTAYQEPPAAPAAMEPPSLLRPAMFETTAPADLAPPSTAIDIPPPPVLNLEYEPPAAGR